MRIQIINGPNINLLGKREPSIYGAESFESYLEKLKEWYPSVEFAYYQSNVEGELINKIHETGFSYDGIVLNAGAYTHTSIALQDSSPLAARNASEFPYYFKQLWEELTDET
jgi:3-dehydroquinate dehydratase-2